MWAGLVDTSSTLVSPASFALSVSFKAFSKLHLSARYLGTCELARFELISLSRSDSIDSAVFPTFIVGSLSIQLIAANKMSKFCAYVPVGAGWVKMVFTMQEYDVVVIGAGHAGCEAALVAARMGLRVLALNMRLEGVCKMSCNPAIGGLAKGHIVKEIDALGGEMAKAIDDTGIQFKTLNRSKGPAVWSSRAQADSYSYSKRMRKALELHPNITLIPARADEIVTDGEKGKRHRAVGVKTSQGDFKCKAIVLTTGTFLRGLVHVGLHHHPAGRAGDLPAYGLSESLERFGFKVGRLKTGTPPRLDGRTINFSVMQTQLGEHPITPFSFWTDKIEREQVPCYVTRTNYKTHEYIRAGLDRSPLYTGVIKGVGPRYCPSIEDKVVRFFDRDSHLIFVEPEGLRSNLWYPNGISTSLPLDVQLKMVHSIVGLERAEIARPGYAIEYDFVNPIELFPWLETKRVENLFFAGQINGTSGYEEAAAQGIIAGINAALRLKNREPLVLTRSQAYIGVLVDDLVTKGVDEPYRMFTSRAEYRLLLREDNADIRLAHIGHELGLLTDEQYSRTEQKKRLVEKEIERLERIKLKPSAGINDYLASINSASIRKSFSLAQILRRPGVTYDSLHPLDSAPPDLPEHIKNAVEVEIKYAGYLARQLEQVNKLQEIEGIYIPPDIDYCEVHGLSTELRQKLERVRPRTLAQAMRIAGMTPAAIAAVQIYIKRRDGTQREHF